MFLKTCFFYLNGGERFALARARIYSFLYFIPMPKSFPQARLLLSKSTASQVLLPPWPNSKAIVISFAYDSSGNNHRIIFLFSLQAKNFKLFIFSRISTIFKIPMNFREVISMKKNELKKQWIWSVRSVGFFGSKIPNLNILWSDISRIFFVKIWK